MQQIECHDGHGSLIYSEVVTGFHARGYGVYCGRGYGDSSGSGGGAGHDRIGDSDANGHGTGDTHFGQGYSNLDGTG